jgi:alkylation response protein AidB-like acyl-CoA dehydrogenase
MIDLLPSADQRAIVEAIAAFLHDRLPAERWRDAGGANEHQPHIWRELADMGCFGLSQDEADGGVGLGLAEQALAFREYGRYLLSPAMLGTVLAVEIAVRSGRAALAADLIAGRCRAGVGNRTPGGWQVFDVAPGDLVTVWDEQGAGLFDAAALGDIAARDCFDGAVSLGLAPGAAEPVAQVAGDGIARQAAVLIAALLAGVVEGAREMAVDYAKTRMQFGQPIGAFQAIKHKCADIGLAAEASWAQTAHAALCEAEATPDAPFQVWNAKFIAGKAALDAARTNIQIHGGMGFTAEINAHLYLKRAHLLNEIGGSLRVLGSRLLHLPTAA